MPYIGRSSNFGVRTRFLYTATASQTTFSGTDTQNLTLSYSDSNFIDVHQNGVLLKVVDDYTATSGTSVVLATGATASDVIEITVYDVFSIANHIKKTGDAMAGALTNIDIDGTELVLDADGDTSITADTDDQIDIRIAGADDFQFTANTFTILSGSTLVNSGNAIQSNAGITIDNITIDGTEIDLSSGDLTLDVAGNIILNADGAYWKFEDGSVEIFQITSGSQNANLVSMVQDKDIRLQGYDGSSLITALNLDMSDAGHATFNNGITLSDGNLKVADTHGIDFSSTSDAGGMANELLDDYEEGTWTPFFGGSSGDPTVSSYATANGKYTKIGNKVYANFVCIASGTPSGGSGDLLIAGLPYAMNATNTQPTGYLGIVNNITNNMSTSQLMLVGQSTSTNINVMNCAGTSTTGTNNLGVDKCHNSGARIDGTFIYTVTA